MVILFVKTSLYYRLHQNLFQYLLKRVNPIISFETERIFVDKDGYKDESLPKYF